MPPAVNNMEKQQHNECSETSMDEKKESSITETTEASTGSSITYSNAVAATIPPQNLYNPYAVAAAAQYHNMMVVQQQQQQPPNGGSLINEMALHHPHAHHVGHPPQQVYVNTVMDHHPGGDGNGALGYLESQFQSLELNNNGTENGRDVNHHSSNNNNPYDKDENGDEDNEGGDEDGQDEDESVKLFVGQVCTVLDVWMHLDVCLRVTLFWNVVDV